MYNLLNIYDCRKCGERLSDQVTHYEEIDHERDEVYDHILCDKCNSEVTMRVSYDIKTRQEIHHYQEVDDERARWAHGFYDEASEEDDYTYRRTCSTCGGEIAEDYSTCWCGIYDDEDDQPETAQTINDNDDLPF